MFVFVSHAKALVLVKKSKKFGTKIVTSAKVRVGLHGVQKTKYVGPVAVAKKRAFKTSPETRAKRRATAQIKRNEKEALRIENELARQRTIYGGLTFAEKKKHRSKHNGPEEKAKAQDVPTGTVRIWGVKCSKLI